MFNSTESLSLDGMLVITCEKSRVAWNRGFDQLDPDTRQRVTAMNRSRVISSTTRARQSKANAGVDRLANAGIDRTTINTQKKECSTPFGCFRSAGEASRQLGIPYQTLVSRIKNTKNAEYSAWYYKGE